MRTNRKVLSLLLAFAFFFTMIGGTRRNVAAVELQGEITLETWMEPTKTTYEVGETVEFWVKVTNSGEYTLFYYQFDDPRLNYSYRYTTSYDDLITPGLMMGFPVEYTFTKEDVGQFINVFTAESNGIIARDEKVFTVIDPNAEPDKPVKPNKPAKPDKPVKPNKPTKPAKPAKPAKPDKPVKPNKPTKPDKPVKPEKPNKPAKP